MHRRAKARAKWRAVVGEQEQSGLSVAAFCRERGVKIGQSFAWKKQVGIRFSRISQLSSSKPDLH